LTSPRSGFCANSYSSDPPTPRVEAAIFFARAAWRVAPKLSVGAASGGQAKDFSMSAKSTPPLAPLQLPAKIADVATGMIFKTKRPTAPRSTVPKTSRRPTPETRIKTALGKAQRKIAPPVALESAATEDSDFVDAPPLIPDESLMAHQALLARVTNAVAPKDIHEEIWVRDVVDLVWDCIRLRRLKLNFLATSARQRLEQVPPPLREADLCSLGGDPATITSQAWGRQEPKDLDLVNRRLASSGLSMEAVMAATQAMHLDSFERMIASAEARRDTAPRANSLATAKNSGLY